MIRSRDDDRPVRLNERTRRAVLVRVGMFAGVACAGEIAFAIGYGWPSFVVAYWPILWLVGWSSNTFSATEWTVAGGELYRRRWLSRPGSAPSAVIALGPQIEIVHETSSRWRIRQSGSVMTVQPWRTRGLLDLMQGANVRVDDWRGNWARRHRLIDALEALSYGGAAVVALPVIALAPLKPDSAVGTAAFSALVGLLVLAFAIDFLPWSFRRPSTQEA